MPDKEEVVREERVKPLPSEAAEEKAQSENSERAQEINMKILVGNEISHSNRINALSEVAVANAIAFSQKANLDYLENSKKILDAYMEQNKKQNEETTKFLSELHSNSLENDRYTLDRLYSVYPEEAAGVSAVLLSLADLISASAPPVTKQV